MDTQEENIFQRLVRESEENRVNDNSLLIQMIQALNSNLITRFQPGGKSNFDLDNFVEDELKKAIDGLNVFEPSPVNFQETPDVFFGETFERIFKQTIHKDGIIAH